MNPLQHLVSIPPFGHTHKLILLPILVLLVRIGALQAQAPPFQKSVLDSVRINKLNFSFSMAFNFSRSDVRSLTSYSNVGLLYSSKRDDHHLDMSHFRDRFDRYSSANRFYIMYYMGLGSHDSAKGRLVERQFYPEPFYLHSFDGNRGIRARDQLGINAAVNLKPTRIWKQKAGIGALVERTNWQLIKRENLPRLDTLPADIQKLIFDTIGISHSGTWARTNIYLNLYSNFSFAPFRELNINGFLSLQIPFLAPYGNLPQIPKYPTVTKKYVRLTTNIQCTYNITSKLAILTNFALQYDKGQVPLYLTNLVYTWTQGVQVVF